MTNKQIAGAIALVVIAAAGVLAYRTFVPSGVDQAFVLKPDDADVTLRGRELYVDHCAQCHGGDLEGEPNWRQRKPSGLLPAPPHDETGHTWHHADAMLISLTKHGPQIVAGPDYQSDMPAFEGQLTDDEIIAVLSYIKSTWPSKVRATHDEINRNSVAR